MGTRGCIARVTPEGFVGRYHHWDSYPSGLGETLWRLYHGQFDEDLEAMLKTLIDDHPAGWSTICGKDFDLKAGFGNITTKDMDDKTVKYRRPQCYCHGERKEKEWLVTDKNASSSGVEWTYAFDVEKKTMQVLSSFCENGEKMIGFFGCGDPKAKWRIMAIVDLEGKEPNWKEIEESVN